MKKLILLLLFIPLVSCDFIKPIPLEEQECCINYKCCDPLENKYDSDAVIFNDKNYSKQNILEVVRKFGPLEFRKENGNWITYSIRKDTDFKREGGQTKIIVKNKLFRIPLDSIYNKDSGYSSQIITDENYMAFSNRKKLYLDNVISIGVNVRNGKLLAVENKEFKISDFHLDRGLGKVIAHNTTNKTIKNFKIKLQLYDAIFDGKLIDTDTISIEESFETGKMKEIEFKTSISIFPSSTRYSYGYNIEILK